MLLGESSGEDAPAERRGFWRSRGGKEAKAALVSRGRSPWLSGGGERTKGMMGKESVNGEGKAGGRC